MKEKMEYRCTIKSLPNEIKTKIVKYGFSVNTTEEFQRFRKSGRCVLFMTEIRTERQLKYKITTKV